jgi:3-polyprenyl-4-hydroxybenzoate decarboxylase
VLERADFRKDLFVFSDIAMDTLDYTGPEVNKGSKGVLLGMCEPKRELPRVFDTKGHGLGPVKRARAYCPGCLVLEVPGYEQDKNVVKALANLPAFADWPLLVAVDDLDKTLRSDVSFLWTAFTRFEPAADLYAAGVSADRNKLSYQAPILIDARMKPWYPKELFCDPATARTVDQRWKEYFPAGGIEMGSSALAHL